MNHDRVNSFLEPLSGLQALLERAGYPWMLIGGVAVSLLGKPRFTADIDAVVLVDDEAIPLLLKQAENHGFKARIKEAAKFAQKNRVLLLQQVRTGINLDISLGLLPFERQAVQRSRLIKIANISIRLPTPEDLIIFKAVAHRPKDIEDIAGILETHPRIDRPRIRKTVKEFARALEMPEIWDDIAHLFS